MEPIQLAKLGLDEKTAESRRCEGEGLPGDGEGMVVLVFGDWSLVLGQQPSSRLVFLQRYVGDTSMGFVGRKQKFSI